MSDFRHFNFVFTSKRESFSRKFVIYKLVVKFLFYLFVLGSFSVHGDFKNYLRIAFSHLPKEKVIKEAEIVVECIRESVESRK